MADTLCSKNQCVLEVEVTTKWRMGEIPAARSIFTALFRFKVQEWRY